MDWNQKEKDHLKVLCDYVKANQYVFELDIDEDETDFIEFDKFQYEWICYAQEELKWEKSVIAAIITNGYKVKNKEGELDLPIESLAVIKRSSEISCSCSTRSDWCQSGFCETIMACNKRDGCGTLMRYTCDGLCSGF